jgi:hypothetical protein
MRTTLAALLLVAAPAAPARAVDLRVLAGADALFATDPSVSGVAGAELGLTLRAEARRLVRRPGPQVDLKLDFAGRESLVGQRQFNNLYELKVVVRDLARGRVDLAFGRLRLPGGFWLFADGAMLTARYTPWLSQSFYGGLRSFTSGRRNTWMADSPVALPIAGTALSLDRKRVQAQLSFTYAKDAVDLPLGAGLVPGQLRLERHLTDEYFLDGWLTVYPHDRVFLTAGASMGTRYDVQFDAQSPYGPTTLGVSTLGAVSAYALGEGRPHKRVRLQYSFNFERVRLFQSTLLTLKPDGTPVQAVDGSFQDHVVRAVWLAWRALRVEGSYRLRYRANTDLQHRLQLGARGDDLFRGMGVFLSIGIDVNTLTGKIANRVIYSGGLSYVRPWLDLRAGVLFTDGIGSGLAFSARQASYPSGAPAELFPYVLESNRVAFVRGFATFWKMYAGLDVEENLDRAQLRVLAQIGASL